MWRGLTDNVNLMVRNRTDQVRDTAEVTTAVARGDLSEQGRPPTRVGGFLVQKNTINTMVDQLSSFADEVTRVAREVGTAGMLGGQAGSRACGAGLSRERELHGVEPDDSGAKHRRRVHGSRKRRPLAQDHRRRRAGEVAALADAINAMVKRIPQPEGPRVAREVGTEGKLGGQAEGKQRSHTPENATYIRNGPILALWVNSGRMTEGGQRVS